VAYETEVSAALQKLRQEVFARGEYVFGDGLPEDQIEASMTRARPEFEAQAKELLAKADDPSQPEHLRAAFREFAENLKEMANYKAGAAARRTKRKPKTIDELLDVQAESGTHSILDIVGISREPKFGHVRPFPREKLVEFFGSETPSRAAIEEAHDSDSLEDFVSERWEGVYIIAYRDGSPSEIFFGGCSGDCL